MQGARLDGRRTAEPIALNHADFGYNDAMPRIAPKPVRFRVELERETDGRWIAEIPELPGVLAYGKTRADACARVQALALRVLSD